MMDIKRTIKLIISAFSASTTQIFNHFAPGVVSPKSDTFVIKISAKFSPVAIKRCRIGLATTATLILTSASENTYQTIFFETVHDSGLGDTELLGNLSAAHILVD